MEPGGCCRTGDPGVIDQQIHRAELFLDGRESALDLLRPGDVNGEPQTVSGCLGGPVAVQIEHRQAETVVS